MQTSPRDGAGATPGVYEDHAPPPGHKVLAWVLENGRAATIFAREDVADELGALLDQANDARAAQLASARPTLHLHRGGLG